MPPPPVSSAAAAGPLSPATRGADGVPIRFEQVRHSYGTRAVLRGIDLELTERRVGVVGANGSGKSTLARTINGLVRPTGGRVTVGGVEAAVDGRAVRRTVGFVFTDPDNQIVMPTVAEDVAFSLRRSGFDRAEVGARVGRIIDRLGLAGMEDHPAHLLSGGQKQLLALAAVLVREPAIVVADEPTTLLDLRNGRRLMAALDALDQQLVVVTHQLELLAEFDRVVVLDDGRVAADDEPGPALRFYRRLVS